MLSLNNSTRINEIEVARVIEVEFYVNGIVNELFDRIVEEISKNESARLELIHNLENDIEGTAEEIRKFLEMMEDAFRTNGKSWEEAEFLAKKVRIKFLQKKNQLLKMLKDNR